MKVVLKPGGVVLVLAAVFGLSFLAIRSYTTRAVPRTSLVPTVASASQVAGENRLLNGGFEDDYTVYKKVNLAKGVDIAGAVAKSWADNSGWGSVTSRYEKDDANPHSGRSAQKITLQKVGVAYTQFVQYLDIPKGTKLEGTIWARSDTPLKTGDAGIVLRKEDHPQTAYGETGMLLTTEWQSYTVRATVSDTSKTMFIVYVRRAGVSVWLDEASLHIVP